MSSALKTQSFDLVSRERQFVDRASRSDRRLMGVVTAGFAILTVYAVVGLPRALDHGQDPVAYSGTLVFLIVMTWFAASSALIRSAGPALELALTNTGVELRFPARKMPRVLCWSDPRFTMLLRDFRGHPTPMSGRIQIESIGRAPFWLQVPTSPLTPAAFDALLSAARAKGLVVTESAGSTKFALYPNTLVAIRHA